MTLAEILPTLQSLPRGEKLQLIQMLAADLAHEEGITLDLAEKSVAIGLPHEASAATLLSVLDADKANP